MHAIPVTVIGGYLGAGKTTLVNHLLRNANGERIAVLVNDFGDIGIDADLIESRDGDVISLAGGCVCCSFGSDLMEALMRIARIEPRADRVVIETSGVALPRAVARTVKLAAGLAFEAVIVMADASTLRERANDRYVGDTVTGQLREADLLVLNKIDLVEPREVAALRQWLVSVAAQAATIEAVRCAIPAELLFGPALSDEHTAHADDAPSRATRRARHAPPMRRTLAPVPGRSAGGVFESLTWQPSNPVDVAALARELARPELGIARSKGLLLDIDSRPRLVQIVGTRADVAQWHEPLPGGSRLVCIGARGRFDRSAIESLLGRYAAALAEAGGDEKK